MRGIVKAVAMGLGLTAAAALASAAREAAAASSPISDVRASERYRRAMAEVIARRAVEIAVARARGTAVPIPASGARP